MKAIQRTSYTNKKMGKRIYTLKELAQKDFTNTPRMVATDAAPIFNLANIQEDLLDDQESIALSEPQLDVGNTPDKAQTSIPSNNQNLDLSIKLINQLISKEISKTADALELEIEELQAWVDLQVITPRQTLLALLRMARSHNLDPPKGRSSTCLIR